MKFFRIFANYNYSVYVLPVIFLWIVKFILYEICLVFEWFIFTHVTLC